MVKLKDVIRNAVEQVTMTGAERIPLVDEDGSGVTEHATLDTVKAWLQTAHDGRYGLVEATSEMFVAADSFSSVFGSPSYGEISNIYLSGWEVADGATEIVSTVVHLPPSWNEYDLDILWTTEDPGAGTVRFRSSYGDITPGVAFATSSSGLKAGAPLGSQVIVKTRLLEDETISSNTMMHTMRRDGAQASDTFAASIVMLGLLFTGVLTRHLLTKYARLCRVSSKQPRPVNGLDERRPHG